LWPRFSVSVGVGKVSGRERGTAFVFGADGEWGSVEGVEWPGDVEGGVVPEDGALAGGVIEVGGFVEDFGGIGEDKEAVSEAFGDPEEFERVGGGGAFEVESGPFTEVRGVAAKIDGDVPDVS